MLRPGPIDSWSQPSGAPNVVAASIERLARSSSPAEAADEQRHRVGGTGGVEVDHQVGPGDHGRGQTVGDPLRHGSVGAAGKAPSQVAAVEWGQAAPGGEGERIGDGDDAEPAGDERLGGPACEHACRGDALELVAVDPAEDRNGRTGPITGDRQHLDLSARRPRRAT